jgi:hypothetical protein
MRRKLPEDPDLELDRLEEEKEAAIKKKIGNSLKAAKASQRRNVWIE